jgi:hypothetical protein
VVLTMIHPELLSRLYRARAIYCRTGRTSPSLAAIARTSGLTPFHFIRLFKAIFGNPVPVSLAGAGRESEASACSNQFVDHRRLHGCGLFQPRKLQRSLFASYRHVAVGISTTVPARIGAGTAAARQLDPWLPVTHDRNFGERAIFEKTARGRD